MNKQELKDKMTTSHNEFVEYVDGLSPAEFEFQLNNEKWNAGQEVLHIIKSVTAFERGLGMPKVALKLTFGKANRPAISYDEMVETYLSKLAGRGAKTIPPFEPGQLTFSDKEGLIEKLNEKVIKTNKVLDKFSEDELNVYQLPHPLLGKLTMREMTHFTIFHVGHHMANSKKNLARFNPED